MLKNEYKIVHWQNLNFFCGVLNNRKTERWCQWSNFKAFFHSDGKSELVHQIRKIIIIPHTAYHFFFINSNCHLLCEISWFQQLLLAFSPTQTCSDQTHLSCLWLGKKKPKLNFKKSCRTTCTGSVRHGASRSQIRTSAISCSCSNWYTGKHFSLLECLPRDCLGCSYVQPSLYFLSHSRRQEWWPFTGLPEQKANTTLFLVRRGKTEHNRSGCDPALCCWDNGKCGGDRKQGEKHSWADMVEM